MQRVSNEDGSATEKKLRFSNHSTCSNRAMSSSKYVNTPERRRSKDIIYLESVTSPMLGRFSSRDHRTRDMERISRLLRCPFTAIV